VNNQPPDNYSSAIMERYQVILAYDGSSYKGFQRQASARSVQAVVEGALRKLDWQGKSILAAGRTDTGVHATGQVIAFDLDWKHEPQDLLTALNSYLPFDVVARQVQQVDPSFHPRHDASWRKYAYRIYCQQVRQPLLEPYAWRIWPVADLDVLHQTAQILIGTHDFSAFGTPPQTGGNTVRVVLDADWKQDEPYLVFEITAQAFLYHMVRRLVFMQIAIAQRKLALSELQQAIQDDADTSLNHETGKISASRLVHGMAPARGLILEEVHYPPGALGHSEDER
jgi:tRNA pseudouridine38-40 synthase